MAIPDEIKMLSPWTALDVDRAKVLEAELMRELSPGHVLEGRRIKALASRGDRDDVLFEIEDGTAKLALVHMTWRKELDSKWPSTMFFNGWEQWAQDVLLPSHHEYTLAE